MSSKPATVDLSDPPCYYRGFLLTSFWTVCLETPRAWAMAEIEMPVACASRKLA